MGIFIAGARHEDFPRQIIPIVFHDQSFYLFSYINTCPSLSRQDVALAERGGSLVHSSSTYKPLVVRKIAAF